MLLLYALVPVGVVTAMKYVIPFAVDPSVTGGELTVIDVDPTLSTVAERTTLSLAGVPPDSSMKLTVVAFCTNPVPLIVTDVPPRIEPELGCIPVTVGTTGDHTQLSVLIPEPQNRPIAAPFAL
jgi:hypothetical protein